MYVQEFIWPQGVSFFFPEHEILFFLTFYILTMMMAFVLFSPDFCFIFSVTMMCLFFQ